MKHLYNIVILIILILLVITLFTLKKTSDETNRKLDNITNVLESWEIQ